MNLAQLPIIGSLIQKGQAALASGVQNIKERIATFHLIPQRIANFKARADMLSRMTVVSTNTDDVATILKTRDQINSLSANYDSVNRMLDLAMDEVNKVSSGLVSIAAAGQVASTISGMNDVMSRAQSIDNTLAGIERRVLTPQQLAQVPTLGLAPISVSSGISPKTLGIGLLIFGGIAYATRRGRRRRR